MALVVRPVAWIGPQPSEEADLLGFDSANEGDVETEAVEGEDQVAREVLAPKDEYYSSFVRAMTGEDPEQAVAAIVEWLRR